MIRQHVKHMQLSVFFPIPLQKTMPEHLAVSRFNGPKQHVKGTTCHLLDGPNDSGNKLQTHVHIHSIMHHTITDFAQKQTCSASVEKHFDLLPFLKLTFFTFCLSILGYL